MTYLWTLVSSSRSVFSTPWVRDRALDGEPIGAIRAQLNDFGSKPLCSLIGGERTAPDRAAFYNGALVRYLDYMDSYLAKDETIQRQSSGDTRRRRIRRRTRRDLPDGSCRSLPGSCSVERQAPVVTRIHHTTQGAYAVGAGVAKALGLDAIRTANAIALSGVGNVALRVTRTGELSQWKGLAYPNTAFIGTHAVFLAMRGITGPAEVFEGNKGFKESISGPYRIDWESENLERVTRTIVKKYNAEIHAQSTIEDTLELRELHGFGGDAVARVEIDIFDVAHKIIGGGEEGDKTIVCTKEQADHSLQYMVAVALCDGKLLPAQYAPQRILAPDVQSLLRSVAVRPGIVVLGGAAVAITGYVLMFPFYGTTIDTMQYAQMIHAVVAMLFVQQCSVTSISAPSAWKAPSRPWVKAPSTSTGPRNTTACGWKTRCRVSAPIRDASDRLLHLPNNQSAIGAIDRSLERARRDMSTIATARSRLKDAPDIQPAGDAIFTRPITRTSERCTWCSRSVRD